MARRRHRLVGILLLSALSGPLQSRSELYQTPDGRLVYNHSFYREVQDHKELAVQQTAFRRVEDGTMAGDAILACQPGA
jgi:hypothetical protein